MQINVTDIHTSNSVGTYGYCTCGREVRYGKDKECPVCKNGVDLGTAMWVRPGDCVRPGVPVLSDLREKSA